MRSNAHLLPWAAGSSWDSEPSAPAADPGSPAANRLGSPEPTELRDKPCGRNTSNRSIKTRGWLMKRSHLHTLRARTWRCEWSASARLPSAPSCPPSLHKRSAPLVAEWWGAEPPGWALPVCWLTLRSFSIKDAVRRAKKTWNIPQTPMSKTQKVTLSLF